MLWKDITIYYPHWRSGHVRMWFGILEGFVSLPFVYLLNHLIVSYGPWILCTLGCNPTPLYSVVPVVPTLTTLRSSVVSYVSLKCLRYCVSVLEHLPTFFPVQNALGLFCLFPTIVLKSVISPRIPPVANWYEKPNTVCTHGFWQHPWFQTFIW